jgi:hypothetical protein
MQEEVVVCVFISMPQTAASQPIRVRVLGHYRPVKFAGYGVAEAAKLTDVENPGDTTEFTVPLFSTLGIIDLAATK